MKTFSGIQSVFLSFILLFITTTQDSWAQVNNITPPPGAIQVTPEEFQALKKDEVQDPKKEDGNSSNSEWARGLNGVGGEAAVIIFAIVGTVMLIAWIPYVALLAYRGIKNPELYKFNYIFSTQFMNIEERNDLNQRRLGEMYSFRFTPISSSKLIKENSEFSTYFKKSYGFNFEIGYYNFYDQIKGNGQKLKYHGPYWLVGPSFILGSTAEKFTMTPAFIKLDLTAGTSFHQEVDLILRGEISLNFMVDSGFFIGAGVSGLYLYGREGKGIVSHVSDLSTQGVLTTGLAF